jgi:hypothetical protein
MSTYKRIDGDYSISTLNSVDNVLITTNTVKIFGNLDVGGNVTYINVDELNIRDPFILLNSSNTATYAANSGILTHRTTSDFAGLRWSNTANQWQVSSSTDTTGEAGSWVAIATGNVVSAAAGSNTQVQFNDNNNFGASAAFTFDQVANTVGLTGSLALADQALAPTPVASTSKIYANVPAAGDSGIYVSNTTVQDELASRRRAIAFGLIF